MNLIQEIDKEQIKKRPKIKPGDIVAVHQIIKEGGSSKAEASKKRAQIFKGVVIKIQGKGATKTFTVRRISFGVGIERTYPLYSPLISKITISKSTKTRRAKLYYLREKTGKSAKLKEKAVADDVIKFLREQEKIEKEEEKVERSEIPMAEKNKIGEIGVEKENVESGGESGKKKKEEEGQKTEIEQKAENSKNKQ